MSEQIFEYRIRAFLILFFLLPQMIVNFIQDEYRSSFMSIIVERKWHIWHKCAQNVNCWKKMSYLCYESTPQVIPLWIPFFGPGAEKCRVQWRRNLRKSWNRPEILILHKLSGKVLSPWKLTTEDKSQTLIDLESRDFKILHPHTSHPRFLENCQNWHFSHMIRCCVFWGTWQNYDWTMSETDLEWKLWTLL